MESFENYSDKLIESFLKKDLFLSKINFCSFLNEANNATSLFLIGATCSIFKLLDLKVCPVDVMSMTTSAASFLINPSVAP